MKHIFYFVMVLICSSTLLNLTSTFSEQINQEKILWSSNKKLVWDDFKGTRITKQGNKKAETCGEIITVNSYWNNGVPKFDIRCFFIKDRSWTITDNPLSLEHEQIHFDIFEVYTRKIRKSFDSLNYCKIVDFEVYETIFNRSLSQNKNYHKKYDDDVKFERLNQQIWIERIAKELKELRSYEYIPEE